MTQGRFIAVVGPSGVGKDSVMEALCHARPGLHRVRRVITRAAEAGGEDYEAVSAETFARRARAGAFVLHWQAHGLSYGIPAQIRNDLDAGRDVLANLSRGKLEDAAAAFARVHVLAISADPEVLADRLSARGRETPEDIAARLARAAPPMPQGVRVTQIDNSGALEASVAAALAALYPARV
ncbi:MULTISPECIES: phosphonate metabolism protein/1,5-bisphosphokinase (PRPP-forming) PhnN [Rhodophyticola]|jgi:ribose 1,5-bisphosphokinase|uniref:phosphonate metabolism protein/1,5-bisphosphokinase (PRPP-forming) PhnN n=1 Tax=Rhodophyticola TaxID=2680018 RepID=UPI001B1ADB6E|nr:phosphonate metabolism protein/1,5-bisphosphokinase (PRPP-forming) PhnN [Roseicyclus sp.]MBO6623517.1 phosphonate metabolism protein/1,5-bisphosphokinase (PRPP-forming) PhnN [Roseicyclus sp.]MBO6923818.1 phosphonate metabolism protein/1,5-bisphosphokinase (PRPP-forming) PhnN [Roseicyclus sp.]